MTFITLLAPVLSLVVLAVAQDTTIQVGLLPDGLSGFVFNPPSIKATVGSVVTFKFSGSPGNHTVTQSSFSSPCEPLEGGFDSGYIQVPSFTSNPDRFPTWDLVVTDDTEPIWFYCAQIIPSPHCFLGMVGAINAPSSNHTFEEFQAAAVSLSSSSQPPEIPSPNLIGVGAQATAPPGPFSGSITGFAVPTGTAPPFSASSSASVPGRSSHNRSSSSPSESLWGGSIPVSTVSSAATSSPAHKNQSSSAVPTSNVQGVTLVVNASSSSEAPISSFSSPLATGGSSQNVSSSPASKVSSSASAPVSANAGAVLAAALLGVLL